MSGRGIIMVWAYRKSENGMKMKKDNGRGPSKGIPLWSFSRNTREGNQEISFLL